MSKRWPENWVVHSFADSRIQNYDAPNTKQNVTIILQVFPKNIQTEIGTKIVTRLPAGLAGLTRPPPPGFNPDWVKPGLN